MSEDAAEYRVKDKGQSAVGSGQSAVDQGDAERRIRTEALKLGARATVWAEEMLRHATEGDWPRFEWAAGEVVSTGRKAQRLTEKLRAGLRTKDAAARTATAEMGEALAETEGGQA